MKDKENMDILQKKAVALEYNEQMNAPILNAKGRGYIAQKMLEKAKQDDINIYFDEELLENLMSLSIGDEIPQQLYDIVSKVLQYIEHIDK